MKSAWEARVGSLLNSTIHPEFVWSYKPADSAMYGGQPRIDWLACDGVGLLWMIEVKKLADDRKTLNLMTDVSAGQRQALDACASSVAGKPILAVGHEKTLYIFPWREIQWRYKTPGVKAYLLPMTDAPISFVYTGPKKWTHDFHTTMMEHLAMSYPPSMPPGKLSPSRVGPPMGTLGGLPVIGVPSGSLMLRGDSGTAPTSLPPTAPSGDPESSPLTLRHAASIRTQRKKLLSEL